MVYGIIFAPDTAKTNNFLNTRTLLLSFAVLMVFLQLKASLMISSWHRFFTHYPNKKRKKKKAGDETSQGRYLKQTTCPKICLHL